MSLTKLFFIFTQLCLYSSLLQPLLISPASTQSQDFSWWKVTEGLANI